MSHQNIPCYWKDPEWGFPKGRRNLKETNLDCAKREFQEETGISSDSYQILHISSLEEVFIGTNNVRYKHVYYLAVANDVLNLQIDPLNESQKAEVSKIGWFNYDQCIHLLRPYNTEKKAVLTDAYNVIDKFVIPTKQHPEENILEL